MSAKKTDDKKSGLGLEGMNLSDLLNGEEGQGNLGPRMVLLTDIDEDAHQPRTADNPGFSAASLQELAATIEARGVKSPISIRESEDGRFIINHGARRYRASKLAGLTSIPAFVDNDYNDADQVIENVQRNELTAREIADYIGRAKAGGIAPKDIADTLGKSRAWVSMHAALLELPDFLADAFSSGRLRDVTVINEILRLWRKYRDKVEVWFADQGDEITRSSVKILAEFLAKKDEDAELPDGGDTGPSGEEEGGSEEVKEIKEEDPTKLKKAILYGNHNGQPLRILLNRRPEVVGFVWIKYEEDGSEIEVPAEQVRITQISDS